MDNKLPQLIIGGAPKSGTTALANAMVSSGAVAFGYHKELYVLNDSEYWVQGRYSYYNHGLSAYDKAFASVGKNNVVWLDATTTYLYQKGAAKIISQWPKKPLIVFVLREPIARLISNYRYFLHNKGVENLPETLSEYINSLLNDSVHTGNQQVDHALLHGRYETYVQHWAEWVGAENIMLFGSAELRNSLIHTCTLIAERLNLPAELEFREDGDPNTSYIPKSASLHGIARNLSKILPQGGLRNRVKGLYVRVNASNSKKREDAERLDSELMQSLELYYADTHAFMKKRGIS